MNRSGWSQAPLWAAALTVACCAGAVQAADAGAQVVRDAETGQLRAPTAAEAAALRGTRAGTAEKARAVVERKMPSGAIMAEVPESMMQFSVVTRAPDGSLVRVCVQGAEQAEKAVRQPQFAKPLAMSTARTARGMAYEVR